jgi:hypothetical protein
MYDHTISSNRLCKKAVKYILEGIIVAFASMVLPRTKVDFEAVIAIALVAASTFAILDIFSPDVGAASRVGAGLGIGANLVGGIPLSN